MLTIARPLSTLVNLDRLVARRHVEDALLLVEARIIDLDVEHEAVELGLGQRIGAFLLDRVLRGDDEERIGQVVGLLAGGDLRVPASPASRAACVLGGVRLISSARTMLAKIGPLHEAELAPAGFALVEDRRCR